MSNFTHFYWAKILASAEGNQSGPLQGTVSEESAKMTKRELLRGKMQIPMVHSFGSNLVPRGQSKANPTKNWIPTKDAIPTKILIKFAMSYIYMFLTKAAL